MNQQFVLIIIRRFAKAFIAGGVASILVQLAQVPNFATLSELKPWLISLAVAFVSGGLMALEKASQGNQPQ